METISLILNFLLGSGLLTLVFFYNSKKRKEAAEASVAENSARRSQMELEHSSIQFLQSQLAEAYQEIDKMQEIINRKRDEILDLIRRTKDMEIMLIEQQSRNKRMENYTCGCVDCLQREELDFISESLFL